MDSSPFFILLETKSLPLGEAAHAPIPESALTPLPAQAEISPREEELATRKAIASIGRSLASHHFLQNHVNLKDTILQDG